MSEEKIAIIGAYGCGKTVLLSVLAHHFQDKTKDGYQIKPANQEAIRFGINHWNELSNGNWPAPTPPVEKPPVYKWLLCNGSHEKLLITSDIAGEAWSSFITEEMDEADDSTVKTQWTSLKEKMSKMKSSLSLQDVAEHVTSVKNLLNTSNSILFLLDLSQVINQTPGYETVIYLPIALERYLKRMKRQFIPITLVLTKIDQYQYVYEELQDWSKVVHKYIPSIPDSYSIVPVSAVADTKYVSCSNGEMRNCPSQDFSSQGIDELYASLWHAINQGSRRSQVQSVKSSFARFCYMDIPFGIVCILITQLLFLADVTISQVFVFLMIIVYAVLKIFRFLKKNK